MERIRKLREARAIARLSNRHVVRIFDVVGTDTDPWIVMEYVPSRSLQDALEEEGRLEPAAAARIGLDVLDALTAKRSDDFVHGSHHCRLITSPVYDASRRRIGTLVEWQDRGELEAARAEQHAIDLTLMKISQLVADLPEIVEIDVNPLLADERGVLAVGGYMAIAPVDVATGRAIAAHTVDAVKVYGKGQTEVRALDGITVDFAAGRFSAIMGPSGSGKSTLLHCMAGLDSLTSGQAYVGDADLSKLDDGGIARMVRSSRIRRRSSCR